LRALAPGLDGCWFLIRGEELRKDGHRSGTALQTDRKSCNSALNLGIRSSHLNKEQHLKIWHNLITWLDSEPCTSAEITDPFGEFDVNPANGLPMIDGTGLDIEGNVFGSDDPGSSCFMGWSDD
jgi:hypothetical protein